jgi:hypothetical protein
MSATAFAVSTKLSYDGTGVEWIGRTIDGRYVVGEVLGTGGMGVVLRARHQFTGEDVALKMLKPSLELEPDIQARFLSESMMPSAIGHPGIVRVLDAGKTPEGSLYLAMELLVGDTLRGALRRGDVAPHEVRRIALELLDALGAAHARGFIHRDLKPENVFLVGLARGVKLLDFGIAKTLAAGLATPRTAAGVVLGTVAYMAPEQLRDARSVDARADLWAVGVMVYEGLTGRLPFVAGTTDSLAAAVAGGEPEPIRRFVPDAPPELHAFFSRALARDPAARFATCAEMAAALAALPLAEGAPGRLPATIDPSAPTVASAAATPAPVARSARRWIAMAAAAAVTIAAVVVLATRTPSTAEPSAGRPHTPARAGGPDPTASDVPNAATLAPDPSGGSGRLAGEVETEVSDVTARIAYARVRDGVLRVGVAFRNATDRERSGSKPLRYGDMFILDRRTKQKHAPFRAGEDRFVAGPMSDGGEGGRWFPRVLPRTEVVVWAMFPAPPEGHPFDVHVPLVPSFDGVTVDRSIAPATATCSVRPMTAKVTAQSRGDGMLTVELSIENVGRQVTGLGQPIEYQHAYVLDAARRKRYGVVRSRDDKWMASPVSDQGDGGRWFANLDVGRRVTMKIVFEAPPDPVGRVDIVVPLFAPIESVALTGSGGSRDVGTVVTSTTASVGR